MRRFVDVPFVVDTTDHSGWSSNGQPRGRLDGMLDEPYPLKEDTMQYMLQIYSSEAPDAFERLSEDEQQAIYGRVHGDHARRPGSPPARSCSRPPTATTVRVQDGQTLTTDGPFAETKEALGGYYLLEADDLDAAIELAARIPAARLGGAIEVRPRGGALIERVFRDEWGRVLAALIGFLGDFDLAEEAAQEAFAIAAERWPRDGPPANPGALADHDRAQPGDRPHPPRAHAGGQDEAARAPGGRARARRWRRHAFPDERLELIFTCCHPALATDAQVALTLRTLGGLTTDEIARAFLVPRRRWRSGSCAPSARSRPPGSPSASRPRTCCPTGWPRCSRSST